MFNFLIILIAVINLANTQEAPEVDSVAVLSSLASANLDCSLKFGRDLIANNEEIATAIEALLNSEDRPTREPRGGRSKGRGKGRGTRPTEEPESRRLLQRGRGNGNRQGAENDRDAERGENGRDAEGDDRRGDDRRAERGENSRQGDDRENTRQGDVRENTRQRDDRENTSVSRGEPRRGGKGRGRGRRDSVTREPLADGETREPKPTRAPRDDGETPEPRRGGKGRGRRDRATREPLADGETREPQPTRAPCDDDEDSTTEVSSRLRARGRGCGGHRRRRKDDNDESDASDESDATEAPTVALRRSLDQNGQRRRRRRGVEAVISNGSVEVAGLTGEVAFGAVDDELDSVPLTLTIAGVTFSCDVEVRRNGDFVSCRATSEEDFKVRVGCAVTSEL